MPRTRLTTAVVTLAAVGALVASSTGAAFALATEVTQIPFASDGSTDAIAAGEGSVWVVDPIEEKLTLIDPKTNEVDSSIDVDGIVDVAVGAGAAWAISEREGLVKIDAESGSVEGSISSVNLGVDLDSAVVADGSVWAASDFDATVVRVDPETLEVTDSVDVDGPVFAIAAGGGAVWTTHLDEDSLSRIDTETLDVTTVKSSNLHPSDLAVGAGGAWTEASADVAIDGVCRINANGKGVSCVSLPGGVSGLGVGGKTVWVSSEDGKVFKVDGKAKKPKVVETISTDGRSLGDVAVGERAVWIADPVAKDSSIFRLDP